LSEKSFDQIELESILRFVVYTALLTPPNYKWQEFLERKFPSRTPVSGPLPSEKQSKAAVKDCLNLRNTAAKFLLDQSLSAPLNTVVFLYLMGGMTFQSNAQIWNNIKSVSLLAANKPCQQRERRELTANVQDFWPMLIAGYRVWPIVGLLNLSVVPFDYRQLVGSVAGLFWGIFLSLNQMT
jgi:hypothetical protein